MDKTVLLTRSKDLSQSFVEMLQPHVQMVRCQSFINFSVIKVTDIPRSGWILFYSQKGVEYLVKQISSGLIEYSELKIIAFGPKTGIYLKSVGLDPIITGNGSAKAVSQLILENHEIEDLYIVKGKRSLNSVAKYLEKRVNLNYLTVYDNSPDPQKISPNPDILVFTSPMNVRAYFYHNEVSNHQKIVVIGASTASTTLELGAITVYISEKPTIESLAKKVIELLDSISE